MRAVDRPRAGGIPYGSAEIDEHPFPAVIFVRLNSAMGAGRQGFEQPADRKALPFGFRQANEQIVTKFLPLL